MFIFDHIVHATAIPVFMAFNDDDNAADRRLAVMEVILPSSGNNVSVISDSKGSNGDEIFASAQKRNIKKSIRLCSYVGLATYLVTRTQIEPWGRHTHKRSSHPALQDGNIIKGRSYEDLFLNQGE